MSISRLLFTLPFGLGKKAYDATYFELPLEKRGIFGSRRILKLDPEYKDILNKLPGAHIKRKMEPFLDKVKVRKDLIITEAINPVFLLAAGTNSFTQGDAAILVSPGLYEIDEEACTFLLKHEISHIKHDDNLIWSVIPGICQLAASIFGFYTLSFKTDLFINYLITFVALSLFTKYREGKADDFAIENSSIEELKGGRRFFKALQEIRLKGGSSLPKIDILHPSDTSRIEKIENALRTKNPHIDLEAESEEERVKIEVMKEKLLDTMEKINESVKENGGVLAVITKSLLG